jgi:hypothetical protein
MAIDERAARDPFIRQFFERIPAELRGTFTSPQLAALKMTFGESNAAGHAVDIRLGIPVPFGRRKRLYLVILSGRDHRGGKRAGGRGIAGFLLGALKRLVVIAIVLSFLLAILFLLT